MECAPSLHSRRLVSCSEVGFRIGEDLRSSVLEYLSSDKKKPEGSTESPSVQRKQIPAASRCFDENMKVFPLSCE